MCAPAVPQNIVRYCHNKESMCGLCKFARKLETVDTKNSIKIAMQVGFNQLTGIVPEGRIAQQEGLITALLAWPEDWPPRLDNSSRPYLHSFECGFDLAVCSDKQLAACLYAANQIHAALGEIAFLTLGDPHAMNLARKLAAELKVHLYGPPLFKIRKTRWQRRVCCPTRLVCQSSEADNPSRFNTTRTYAKYNISNI